jgi:3-phosphoshikimate 1-carboxyvinyltransferase
MLVDPVPALTGHVAVPGDKSISHRAVLIGAICNGETGISGFGRCADTGATVAAVRALGVEVDEVDVDTLVVRGVGLRVCEPAGPLDCGNADVAAAGGILAGQVPGSARRRRIALVEADGADRRAAAAHGLDDRDDRRALLSSS